ncbi:MAG TPA: biotin carboxylase N-terminal domain-containing protein [Acidimicrobiales bacterium]
MTSPTPIRTLLVANRGEIARRIIRSARAMGITSVAVYSDADADSPHVAEADLAVRLPGVSPADTYLRVDLILEAASRCAADAVHPGYGFLSESGTAARAVAEAGLIWVGPSADAIDAMGSKVLSKQMMRLAGVPTLPSITVTDDDLPAPGEVEDLGWPLLVKASAGGGGRGMRVVAGPDDLTEALAGARREALSAFGDGTVFLERYVIDPRHIEVQVLADQHGETVALFERECSIQRRHQKIIEEAPSPAVTPALRARLTKAALNAAKAVGYVNAGTVEFVLDGDGDPYFLEMNTRLQVEHPVTEAITGLDLVRLQLLIASGQPLPAEVHAAVAAGPVGHAIEARLYAEDPGSGWMPSTGTLHRFEIPTTGPGVRIDSGVESGTVVSPHYDPMLAKVIVHAPTRDEAASALATTLADSRLHGVTTNRDLLVRTLRHPSFLSGDTDTGFLDRFDTLTDPRADEPALRHHAVAAALAAQAGRRSAAPVQPNIPSGYRNSPSGLQTSTFDSRVGVVTVGYLFDRFDRTGERLSRLEIDGAPVEVGVDGTIGVESITPGMVILTVGGVTRRYAVERVAATSFVDGPDGASVLVEHDRFPDPGGHVAPGSSLAPMPGGVVRVAVAVGDEVKPGQLLVVLEAMKMEHAVHAAGAGKVSEVSVSVGDQVETGRVLVVVEGPDG